jgi:glycosyltransferase involved in cell wall biosynthesis
MKPTQNMNVHVYPGTILFEARMYKIANTIKKLNIFDEIVLLGINNGALPEEETLEENIKIKRLNMNQSEWIKKSFLNRVINVINLSKLTFKFLKQNKPSVVHAHNLASLPILVIYKLCYGSKVVYDTHELETERNTWGKLETLLAKIVEFSFIYFTDVIVVVNEDIGRFYKKKYGVNPYSINNVPEFFKAKKSNYLREQFNISFDAKIFIFIGALNPNRGIEEYINFFHNTDLNICLVFLGDGPLKNIVYDAHKNSKKIYFHERVPHNDVVRIASSSDFSISVLKVGNPALSYNLSMPNKLFESMMSGIPILSGGMKSESRFVNENQVGIDIKFVNSKPCIEDAINSILEKDYLKMRKNCFELAKIYNWENQSILIGKYMYKLLNK